MKDRKAPSGRSASSRASTRAANFRCGPNREIIIGRSSRSRHGAGRGHGVAQARQDHAPTITWSRSRTSGRRTERLSTARRSARRDLKDGDRILIGTSIIKIVFVDGDNTSHADGDRGALEDGGRREQASGASPKSMAGSIEEIPLPDLLQLLSTSKKSGVLVVHSDRARRQDLLPQGADLLREHREPVPTSARARRWRGCCRWTQGNFELEPPDESAVLEEMDESTEALLIEAMRQLDEYRVIAEKLPRARRPIGVARPLGRSCATCRRRSWTFSRPRSR